MCALFSPEILQAGAVEGLETHREKEEVGEGRKDREREKEEERTHTEKNKI